MNKIVISGAVIIGILGFAGVGAAAQQIITANGIERAYQDEMSSLGMQISLINQRVQVDDALIQDFKGTKNIQGEPTTEFANLLAKRAQDIAPLGNLQGQEQTIKLTYRFMVESLQ